MRIAKILKRQTLNQEQINKVLDKMSMFINTSIDEVNERDEYIIVIDKNIKGIIYYDKISNELYYDRNTIGKDLSDEFSETSKDIKNGAVEKFFKQMYPQLNIKKVSSKKLTVL